MSKTINSENVGTIRSYSFRRVLVILLILIMLAAVMSPSMNGGLVYSDENTAIDISASGANGQLQDAEMVYATDASIDLSEPDAGEQFEDAETVYATDASINLLDFDVTKQLQDVETLLEVEPLAAGTIDLSTKTPAEATKALNDALEDSSIPVITLTGGSSLQLTDALEVQVGRNVTIQADTEVILTNRVGIRHIGVYDDFVASPSTATLTFKNIVLDGGKVGSVPGGARGGGIVFNPDDQSMTLIVDGIVIQNCRNNGKGGGILSYGNLILRNSTIIKNEAINGDGGGICVRAYDPAQPLPTLDIIDSTIGRAWEANVSMYGSNGGGGIYADGPQNISGSTIIGNDSYTNGGGIWAGSDVKITNSTIEQNPVWGSGKGSAIYSSQDASTISIDSSSTIIKHPWSSPGVDPAPAIWAGGLSGSSLPPAVPAGLKIQKGTTEDVTGKVINYKGSGDPTVPGEAENLFLTWNGNDEDNYQVEITYPDGKKEISEQAGMLKGFSPYSTDARIVASRFGDIQGTYSYKVRTADAGAENWSALSASVILTYDTIAPTLNKVLINGQELSVSGSTVINIDSGIKITTTISDARDTLPSALIKITADDGDHYGDLGLLDLIDASLFTAGKEYTIEITTYDNIVTGDLSSGPLNIGSAQSIKFTAGITPPPTPPTPPAPPTPPTPPVTPGTPGATTPRTSGSIATGTIGMTTETPAAGSTMNPIPTPLTPTPKADVESPKKVAESKTPLASTPEAGWAASNLFLVLLTAILAIVSLLAVVSRRKKNELASGMAVSFSVFNVAAVLVAVIVFILAEDLTLPMQFSDDTTLWMGVIAAVEVILTIFSVKGAKKAANKDA